MINMRQKFLLIELLNSNTPLAALKLAQKLGVSLRTVRYDLQAIDAWLEPQGYSISRTPHRGVFIEDAEAISRLVNNIDSYVAPNVMYEEDRKRYILLDLLFGESYIPSQTYALNMLISRSTVLNSIASLNLDLRKHAMTVEGKTKKGFYLVGDEKAIRTYFRKYILSKYADDVLSMVGSARKPIFSNDDLVHSDEVIRHIRTRFDLTAKPDYNPLRLEILLQIRRIRQGNKIIYTQEDLIHTQKRPIWDQLEFPIKKIQALFGVKLDAHERTYLISLLEYYGITSVVAAKRNYDEMKLSDVIERMTDTLQSYYEMDHNTLGTIKQDFMEYLGKYFGVKK